MKFTRFNSGVIELRKSAEATLLAYRQLDIHAKEAGGMLLGRIIENCDDIVIDEVTTPLASDKSGRFFFFRGKKAAQKLIDESWQKSEATRIYLGEWHTHPEDEPTPSSQDLANWNRIVNKAVYEQESLFFLIVGRKRVRLWEINKSTKELFVLV